MADSGKNAITTHTGDGVETDFAIGFTAVSKDYVTIKLSGDDQGRPPGLWDFKTTGAVTAASEITFVTAPPAVSNNIVITRDSDPATPIVTYADGVPITAADLNKSLRQALDYAEEVEDQT